MLYEGIKIIPFTPTSIMGLMETESAIIPLGKHWPLQPQNNDLTDLVEPNQCEGELYISFTVTEDNGRFAIKICCDTCKLSAERNSALDMFDQKGIWTEKDLKMALARMMFVGVEDSRFNLGCLRSRYQDEKKNQAASMALLDTGLLTADAKRICLALLMPYRDAKWKILEDQLMPINVHINLADAGMLIIGNLAYNSRYLEFANKDTLGYK